MIYTETVISTEDLERLSENDLIKEINNLFEHHEELRGIFAEFADTEARENFLDEVTVSDVSPDDDPQSGSLTIQVFVERYMGCSDLDDAYDKEVHATYTLDKNAITITTESPDWDARYPDDEL